MKLIGRDLFFVERQLWIERLQPKPGTLPEVQDLVLYVVLGILLTACLMAAVPDYQEDFTDQGLGCINDCLDPAEPMPVEP